LRLLLLLRRPPPPPPGVGVNAPPAITPLEANEEWEDDVVFIILSSYDDY
jgi:hypothetical protein